MNLNTIYPCLGRQGQKQQQFQFVFGTHLSLSLRKFVFGIFVFSLFGGEGVDQLGEGVMKPNPLLDRYLVPTPAPTTKKENGEEVKKV